MGETAAHRTGLAEYDSPDCARPARRVFLQAPGWGSPHCWPNWRRAMEADVVVMALIGERGREVNHFVEEVLGPDGHAPRCGGGGDI